jgi:hypothetical protein
VDDEARPHPAAGGLLELVGPPAVVSERPAAEELRVVRRRLVGEQDDDLVLDVDPRVVVPAELRGGDPVADEHGLGVEAHVAGPGVARAGKVVAGGKVECGTALRGPKRGLRVGNDAQERDRLEVRPAVAAGGEPGLLELAGDEVGGQLLAAGAGPAALEPVARQVNDIGLHPLGGDCRLGRPGGGDEEERQEEC